MLSPQQVYGDPEMQRFNADAPAKLILLGEHAVVYGQPGFAIPLEGVSARAEVFVSASGEPARFELADYGIVYHPSDLPVHPVEKPFRAIFELLERRIGHLGMKGWTCHLESSVPIGCGLGSGAAVTGAVIKALTGALGVRVSGGMLSDMVFEIEKLHHGTPSGIDNTVVSMVKPVLFQKGKGIKLVEYPARSLNFIVGCTDLRHDTSEVVADVRQRRNSEPDKYNEIFEEIGRITIEGTESFIKGDSVVLGDVMNRNHELLQKLDVSCPELDRLVEAAIEAGAAGAKMSGAGRGGCMVAVAVNAGTTAEIEEALKKADAVRIMKITIPASPWGMRRNPWS